MIIKYNILWWHLFTNRNVQIMTYYLLYCWYHHYYYEIVTSVKTIWFSFFLIELINSLHFCSISLLPSTFNWFTLFYTIKVLECKIIKNIAWLNSSLYSFGSQQNAPSSVEITPSMSLLTQFTLCNRVQYKSLFIILLFPAALFWILKEISTAF